MMVKQGEYSYIATLLFISETSCKGLSVTSTPAVCRLLIYEHEFHWAALWNRSVWVPKHWIFNEWNFMSWYSRVQVFHTFFKNQHPNVHLTHLLMVSFKCWITWVFFIWSFLKRCWTIRLMLRWFYAVSSLQQCGRRSLFPRVSYLTTAVFDGLVGVDTLIIQLSACGPVKDKPSGVLQKKTLQKNKTGGVQCQLCTLDCHVRRQSWLWIACSFCASIHKLQERYSHTEGEKGVGGGGGGDSS